MFFLPSFRSLLPRSDGGCHFDKRGRRARQGKMERVERPPCVAVVAVVVMMARFDVSFDDDGVLTRHKVRVISVKRADS
jgi:hypothetical protein